MRPWKTVDRRVVWVQEPWLEVSVERIALPDGRTIDEYIQLRGRDFSIVAAFTEDGRIPLIRSYTHGTRRVSLSLPAGYLEPGEAPMAGAKRELLEETGYTAARWEPLGAFVVHGNYGLGTENAFVARGARRVAEPNSGDFEEMEVVLLTADEVRVALRNGEISQLSTVGALSLALLTDE